MKSICSRLTLVLTVAAFVSGCSDSSGVKAVQDIYEDRAVAMESDAQYEARQSKAVLKMPVVVENDKHSPVLRWATYDPNAGLLAVHIPVMSVSKTHATLNFGEDNGAVEKKTRRQHFMTFANVSVDPPAWVGSVRVEPGVAAQAMFKGMRWELHHTPSTYRRSGVKDDQVMLVSVKLEKVRLVDELSDAVLWEKGFLGDGS